MAETLADRLRELVGADLYTRKGKLRSDDLLVRERACGGLGEAAAHVRALASRWRAERVPPSTREQPFPPPAAMEPLRRADRLTRALEDAATEIRGLPLLGPDKAWDRARSAGLGELLLFDWTLVGAADLVAEEVARASDLASLDVAAVEGHLASLRSVTADRRRYLQALA